MNKVYKKLCLLALLTVAIGCLLAGCNSEGTGETAIPTDSHVDRGQDPQETETHTHSYTIEEIVAPGCNVGGYSVYVCPCGDRYTADNKPSLGHLWGDWYVVKEATTKETGVQERACNDCGAKETKSIEKLPDQHVHSYRVGFVGPTCAEQGYTYYLCQCGDSYKENYIPALGHIYVSEATEPTCAEQGYTVYTCMVCDDVSVSDYTDALGHDYSEWVVLSEPTCTQNGDRVRTCSVCQTLEEGQIDALGHSYQETGAAPTCTEGGYVELYCTVCQHSEVREDGPLGHSYSSTIFAPTCTEDGFTKHVCAVCGDSYVTDTLSATGHDYTEITAEPTCEDPGYTEYVCSICANNYRLNVADALGHDFGLWSVTKAASCTAKGEERRSCSRCSLEESKKIAATGHDYKREIKAPSCTEGGYTLHACKNCGDTYKSDLKKSLGHSYGPWKVKKEPTLTEAGTKVRTCKTCGKTETQKIDRKVPIDLEEIVVTDLFAGMNEDAQPVVEAILKTIQENYGRNRGKDEPTYLCIYKDHDLDYAEYHEMSSYLSFYFGTFGNIWNAISVQAGSDPRVCVDIDMLCDMERDRQAMMKEIEQIISTFGAGTEEELVEQAYTCIAARLSYEYDQADAVAALTTGGASCNAYSTLLRLMLHRLGIESDICVGYTAAGDYHAWNRVNYKNGQVKYYDLTFYEKNGSKYVGATSSYHKISAINCYL